MSQKITNYKEQTMKTQIEKLEQFLTDEQELLKDLALDVANANSDYEQSKAKAVYATQQARITGIQDTIKLALKDNYKG